MRRIIRRLAGAAAGADVAETQLVQVERIDIHVDGTNRIVPANVILQTRRQKTCLIAALARLIGAVRRHASNRTLARVADNGNSCPASTLFRPTSRASAFSEIAREIAA